MCLLCFEGTKPKKLDASADTPSSFRQIYIDVQHESAPDRATQTSLTVRVRKKPDETVIHIPLKSRKAERIASGESLSCLQPPETHKAPFQE